MNTTNTIERMSAVNARLNRSQNLPVEDYLELKAEFADLEDELIREFAIQCSALGEHMTRITSVNGFDVCANCGART